MIKGLVRFLIVVTLLISAIGFQGQSASAKTNKVMWGKTELKWGQIGKVTILGDTKLYQLSKNGEVLTVSRTLKKGEEFRVYSTRDLAVDNYSSYYVLGGDNYIKSTDNVKYETPSKGKLAQLKDQDANPLNPANKPANKPVAKPVKTPSTTINNGEGSLKGTVTWQYNKFIGTKPDVGAKVYVIPSDFDSSSYTESEMGLFASIGSIPKGSNLHFGKVNGFGSYEIGGIPVGRYLVIISSKNTTRNMNDEVWAKEIIEPLLGKNNYEKFELFNLIMANHHLEYIEIKKGKTIDYSNDFGYTYF